MGHFFFGIDRKSGTYSHQIGIKLFVSSFCAFWCEFYVNRLSISWTTGVGVSNPSHSITWAVIQDRGAIWWCPDLRWSRTYHRQSYIKMFVWCWSNLLDKIHFGTSGMLDVTSFEPASSGFENGRWKCQSCLLSARIRRFRASWLPQSRTYRSAIW